MNTQIKQISILFSISFYKLVISFFLISTLVSSCTQDVSLDEEQATIQSKPNQILGFNNPLSNETTSNTAADAKLSYNVDESVYGSNDIGSVWKEKRCFNNKRKCDHNFTLPRWHFRNYFGFKICKHIKSNAIVLIKNRKTIGIGAGQMSRIDATKISVSKISNINKNINYVAASDAFFPFIDNIQFLLKNKCRAIVQPSGSINDSKIIDFANKNNLPLYFSKYRFFKH